MAALPPYPTPRRDDSVVEDFHGTQVADPYRWMEDPDSAETQAWIAEENKITDAFYAKHEDTRKFLNAEFTKGFTYPRYSCPWTRGGNWFFTKNNGLQNQSVIYKQVGSYEAEPTVFLDPNVLAEDGTKALRSTAFTESGKYYAYGISTSGSDWMTIYVRDVETGEDLPDKVEWSKFSGIDWTHDDKGFFYTRYPVPGGLQGKEGDEQAQGKEVDTAINAKCYYHRLGTPQAEDLLVYEIPDQPIWRPGAEVSDDGKYILIGITDSCDPVNRVFIAPIEAMSALTPTGPCLAVDKIIDNFDFGYDYITNDGDLFYFKTNRDAPKYKVVTMSLKQPGVWNDLVPETADVLEDARCVRNDLLVLIYLKDVQQNINIHKLADGSFIQRVNLPTIGVFSHITGRRNDGAIFYSFMGFSHPGCIMRVDLTTMESTLVRSTEIEGHNPDDYESKQVFFTSKDGTRIPMFIVHRKGLVLDGSNPALLYGYGGFNISEYPRYNPFRVVFMRAMGGVVGIVNLRGGGEYGEEWHKAGTKERKQNVFDDFIAAGEHLVAEKYTSPKKLAILGGSNGGLLVAACCNQRPDLFGAAISQVGVLDMLRFHKFTIGHAWMSDFGCPDKPEEFPALYKYSPLHNIAADKPYPHVLLTTADHDDRVVPLHSFKFAAELQHRLGGQAHQTNPLLIRIEVKAGHGAGKPIAKSIAEAADIYTFMAAALGASVRTGAA